MANPFDQFDAAESNPFDQFDKGAKRMVTPKGQQPDLPATSPEYQKMKSRFLAQETGKPYMTAMHTAAPVQPKPKTYLQRLADPENLKAYAKTIEPIARPTISGLASVGGGALGLASPIPGGTLIGGTLGYAGGQQAGDILFGEREPAAPGEGQTMQTLRDIYEGGKGELLGLGAGALLSKVPGVDKPVSKFLGTKLEEIMPIKKINDMIKTGIEKGIRPSVEGKKTFSQSSAYLDKAQSAVKSIIENKDNLQLTDEFGEATKTLPQNLKQFSQAIEQTKGQIFKQYNDLATKAGEMGATVELHPIANELTNVANNKVLQRVAPNVAKYAQDRAKSFAGGGAREYAELGGVKNTFTASEAQEAITSLNNSLEAFYKNPSYDTASRAYIDSLIVNRLRKSLDDVIEKSVAPGYQDLKRTYGALKTIEKDVNRRAVVDARKNVKGLIDFSDVFSGSQVVQGIVTMNPATVTTGISAKIIANLYKMKNDPNRIVSKMFKNVDKLYTSPPKIEGALPQIPPARQPVELTGKVGTLGNYPQPQPIELTGKVGTLGNYPQPGPRMIYDPIIGRYIPSQQ